MTVHEVCAINIGPGQRRMRAVSGGVGLALGVVLAATLGGLGLAWPWRLTVFLLFFGGALGVLQARAKT